MSIKIVDVKDISKSHDGVNSVIKTFSPEDRHMLGMKKSEHTYLSPKQYKYITKRFVLEDDGKIVGFFDILADGEPMYGNITFGLAPWARGKGYGYKLAKAASDWIDQHIKEFDNVQWSVLEENKPSIAIARKLGWIRMKSRDETRSTGHYIAFVKSPKLKSVKETFDSIKLK